MAISDYIPNLFGSVPDSYQGLLGEQQTKDIQSRANIQGLLGAAAALSQGMSSQGPRRSALQNILGSLAGGYQAAGGSMEQGLKNYQTQLQLSQAIKSQEAINSVLKDPKVANDPVLSAYFRTNPGEAFKYYMENMPIQQALTGGAPTAAPAVPQASIEVPQPVSQEPAQAVAQPEGNLPEVPVVAKPSPDAGLLDRKNQLIAQNQRLGMVPSKTAQDRIKTNLDEITAIDKQLDRSAVSGFNFQAIENAVPKQFKNRVRNLQQAAETGAISMADLTSRLQDIEKEAVNFVTKKTDYTNQDRRVAAGMFGGRPIEELNPQELMQLQAELDRNEIAKRRAGATVIDMGSREMEKEFAKGVVEDTRASFQQAKSGLNTIKTVARLQPLISAGVYEGALAGAPRAVDQIATALGVSGKNTQEKLARTAQTMQGLASLELDAAAAMKGQGAITENERALIARAAGGNLRDFTAVEVNSLLGALDKVARAKVEAHQSNWEVMNEDPIGRKYSKYYKIENVPAPTSTVTPAQESAPSGVTVRKVR